MPDKYQSLSAIKSKVMSVVEHKKDIRRTHRGRKNKSRSKSYGSNWVASAICISARPKPDRDKSLEECNQSEWGPTQSLSPKLTTDAKSKSWWRGNKTYQKFVCRKGGCGSRKRIDKREIELCES